DARASPLLHFVFRKGGLLAQAVGGHGQEVSVLVRCIHDIHSYYIVRASELHAAYSSRVPAHLSDVGLFEADGLAVSSSDDYLFALFDEEYGFKLVAFV